MSDDGLPASGHVRVHFSRRHVELVAEAMKVMRRLGYDVTATTVIRVLVVKWARRMVEDQRPDDAASVISIKEAP